MDVQFILKLTFEYSQEGMAMFGSPVSDLGCAHNLLLPLPVESIQ